MEIDLDKLQTAIDEMRPLFEEAFTEVAVNLRGGMSPIEVVEDLISIEVMSFNDMTSREGMEYALYVTLMRSAVMALVVGEHRMVRGAA